jgi:gluconolactonase
LTRPRDVDYKGAMHIQEIASGLRFPEGPVWMPDGSIVLVEIEAGRVTRVSPDGAKTTIATPGGGPNGAAIGPDGALYVCNNGGFEWHEVGGLLLPGEQPHDYSGGRIERVDLATGAVTVLYRDCGGFPLRGPNDLVFDARHGGFWFTDHGKTRKRDRDRGGLYWAKADGSEIREVVYPLDSPNGVGLSPDGARVYVAETWTGRVWWWAIAGPGRVTPAFGLGAQGGTLLAGLPGMQLLDSLAVDAEGHVCAATIANGGVTAISPDGSQIEHFPLPDPLTTNVCFGGTGLRTAFATLSGTGRLVSFEWPRPGLPLAY